MERDKIEIVEYSTEAVVESVDVSGKNERQIDKIDRGININLDHDKFYTRILTHQKNSK